MDKQENPVKKELRERIKDIMTYDFYIKKCPSEIYERFCKFAISETRDDYAMALKVLLERNDGNSLMLTLHQMVLELRETIMQVVEDIETLKNKEVVKEDKPKTKTTFGKKDESDEDEQQI